MSQTEETEYESAYRHGQEAHQTTEIEGVPAAFMSNRNKLEFYPGLLERPKRVVTHPEFNAPASFVFYVKKFRDDDSLLFVDQEEMEMDVWFDYHRRDLLSWCDHKACLEIKMSDEWKKWAAISEVMGAESKTIPQIRFLEFIQLNQADFFKPRGADLLELCNNLKGNKSTAFTFGQNLQNGDVELLVQDRTTGEGKKKIQIPEKFIIKIPVFLHADPIEITVWLRYRIEGGECRFAFIIDRPGKIIDENFKAVVEKVAKTTGLEPLFGRGDVSLPKIVL